MAGLLENLRLTADETERLGRATSKVREDLEAVSAIEPDGGGGFTGGELGAQFAAASVNPVAGSAAPGSAVPRLGTGGGGGGGNSIAGGSGGSGGRISMGSGAGGGGGVITSPAANAFIRSQMLPQDAVAEAVATTITHGFNMLAKILKGDGGSRFRIGGGL